MDIGYLADMAFPLILPPPHAVAQRVLPGPAAAAHAAAAASNKQRAAAEEAITRAVSDALHAIAALKGVLPLMEGGPAKVR